MPPEPAACWSDVADATQYAQACAQWNPGAGGLIGSEDCLSLNVWTPALPSASSKPLPVLVWIYGGGDLIGDDSYPGTDGQALSDAEHAVVVSFGYRVGPLGFLAHPALAAANPQHTTGDYGLLDAVLALHWVQDNIASFGGDKTRVMLFGASAGAINTCSLLASPLAHGLFASALMESGNCAAETLSNRYVVANQVLKTTHCASAPDALACLQRAPLSSVLENGGLSFLSNFLAEVLSAGTDAPHVEDLPFAPTVDGYVLTDTPLATIQAGKHNHVPLVIGTNAQERAAFLPSSLVPANANGCSVFASLVNDLLPDTAPAALQAYPCNTADPTSGYKQLTAVLTDAFFACPSRRALRAAAATQTEPVYRYLFSVGVAGHGAEMPYVFNTFPTVGVSPTPADSTLSSQMQSYWVNLAASGNPNGAGLPAWSTYKPTADNALELNTPITDTSAIDAAGCDFWDTVQ
jgi:para-nitrobenzyl esterase